MAHDTASFHGVKLQACCQTDQAAKPKKAHATKSNQRTSRSMVATTMMQDTPIDPAPQKTALSYHGNRLSISLETSALMVFCNPTERA